MPFQGIDAREQSMRLLKIFFNNRMFTKVYCLEQVSCLQLCLSSRLPLEIIRAIQKYCWNYHFENVFYSIRDWNPAEIAIFKQLTSNKQDLIIYTTDKEAKNSVIAGFVLTLLYYGKNIYLCTDYVNEMIELVKYYSHLALHTKYSSITINQRINNITIVFELGKITLSSIVDMLYIKKGNVLIRDSQKTQNFVYSLKGIPIYHFTLE